MAKFTRNMKKLNKNLRFLRNSKGWTQPELAKKLGVKTSVIGSYEENRASPSVYLTVQIAELFSVELEALLKLDIEKLNKKSRKIRETGLANVLAITVDKSNQENVEFVSQKASAGYLNGYSDPEFLQELPKLSIPNLNGATFRCFEVKGDSMLPVNNKDLIVCRYVSKPSEIKHGGTYVIILKSEGIVYKRVFNFLSEDKLLLVSDNPIYDPYSIDKSDVLEIWAFAARITFEESLKELPREYALESLVTQLFKKVSK